MLRFFRNKVRLQEAEDLSQETFLRLVRTSDRIEDGRLVRAYVLGIARRVLLEHIHTRPRERALDPGVDRAVDLAPGASTIIAQREEQELLVSKSAWSTCAASSTRPRPPEESTMPYDP